MRRRHANIDDDELGLVLTYELQELVGIAGLTDDLEVGPLEQAREPLSQKDVIVGHDDATVGGRLLSHHRLNLTPLPGSGYVKIPALRLRGGALVGYRVEAVGPNLRDLAGLPTTKGTRDVRSH